MPDRRGAAVVTVLAVAVGSAAVGAHRLLASPAPASPPPVPTATAPVLRTDVAARHETDGVLGYAGRHPVTAATGGVLTGVPRPGAVLRRGDPLYEVDGRPVRLLYGDRPAWRGFATGMADGPDVRQLERNLVALGYTPGLRVDDHFSSATAAAVRRFWVGTGAAHPTAEPLAGGLPAGAVVFEPGPVRVIGIDATPGAVLQPGTPVLDASSTDRTVTSTLDLAAAAEVRRGDPVRVELADGAGIAGSVASVAPVLAGRAGADPGTGSGGASGSSGGDGRGVVAVLATVTLTGRLPAADPVLAGGLDQVPVRLAITTDVRRRVLAVPVVALLARSGGGYDVAVAGPGGRRVPVTVGLIDDLAGLVEVSGPALAAGMRVEVPAG
jgi:hypothetical protein